MILLMLFLCTFCFGFFLLMSRNGKHVLVAYIMKPKAGYDYLATAAHFAAESSTGTNVNVCTTDDFTKSVDALVYYIDPDNEEMKVAYPNLLFDRNIIDGRGMMCSFLTLAIGNNQGNLFAGDICNMGFSKLLQMDYVFLVPLQTIQRGVDLFGKPSPPYVE